MVFASAILTCEADTVQIGLSAMMGTCQLGRRGSLGCEHLSVAVTEELRFPCMDGDRLKCQ